MTIIAIPLHPLLMTTCLTMCEPDLKVIQRPSSTDGEKEIRESVWSSSCGSLTRA
jgi:hypothetical protein